MKVTAKKKSVAVCPFNCFKNFYYLFMINQKNTKNMKEERGKSHRHAQNQNVNTFLLKINKYKNKNEKIIPKEIKTTEDAF